jgi:hypothetical protein
MKQAWFQILGLSLDFMGVLIIAGEWWFNYGKETQHWHEAITMHNARISALEVTKEEFGSIPPDIEKEINIAVGVLDRAAHGGPLKKLLEEGNTAIIRRRLSKLGITLIIIGFALQIVGSWPTTRIEQPPVHPRANGDVLGADLLRAKK